MLNVQTREIIERLRVVEKDKEPHCDRRRAEKALRLHYLLLSLEAPHIRWVADAAQGYAAALSAAESAAWLAAEEVARSAAWLTAQLAARAAAWTAAWPAAWPAALSAAEPAAELAAWLAAWSAAWLAAESVAWSVAESAALSAAWSAAESAARSEAWSAAWLAAESAALSAAELAARSAAWSAALSAARSAAQSAARSAAWSAALSAAQSADRRKIWLPFVDAYEAGLWLFLPLANEVIAVPRPTMIIKNNRLHCEDGPACWWPQGDKYYFWNGVQVPESVILSPDTLTTEQILTENNAEVRRVMIERFGAERLLKESRAKQIDSSPIGTLYHLPIKGDESIYMMEIACPSTGRKYMLRVPPNTRTALEAVAWTFGLNEKEYQPKVES